MISKSSRLTALSPIKRCLRWQNLLLMFLVAALVNCDNPFNSGVDVKRENGRVIIVDDTGKEWDVTHAEEVYGLKAENFQFGLGPFAITPIQNPEFLFDGDPGFPGPTESFLVIGVDMNGEKRAYPISVLSRHEVTNEFFDPAHVSVAY